MLAPWALLYPEVPSAMVERAASQALLSRLVPSVLGVESLVLGSGEAAVGVEPQEEQSVLPGRSGSGTGACKVLCPWPGDF